MARPLLRSAGRVFAAALSALLLRESRCPGCGRVTVAEELGADGLCPACRPQRTDAGDCALDRPCPGCGEFPPVPQAQPVLCGRCRVDPRPWGRVVVCGRYDGELRSMLLAYKFNKRLELGPRLAALAVDALRRAASDWPELAAIDGLAPVPLHSRRLFTRGYNQSRELARLISRKLGAERTIPPVWPQALARVRRTTPQMRLARAERAENIRGAFRADGRIVSGRRVLLVDDIMTTGATLEECSRALLAAGAARVDVLTLARA